MVRGGHTQGGSRNTPLALLTGHFRSNTHTISVRGETTSLTGIPLPLPSHSHLCLSPLIEIPLPVPTLPSPSLPLLSIPLTSQSSLSSSENSSSFSVRANLKLLSPPTIKNQTGCRKWREGGRERGGGGGKGKERGKEWARWVLSIVSDHDYST